MTTPIKFWQSLSLNQLHIPFQLRSLKTQTMIELVSKLIAVPADDADFGFALARGSANKVAS